MELRLIKYLQVTQTAIEKANKNLSLVDETPVIQVNHNNQLNVNISETLDRDSRERVLAFVKAALQQNSTEETDFVEIEEEDNDEDGGKEWDELAILIFSYTTLDLWNSSWEVLCKTLFSSIASISSFTSSLSFIFTMSIGISLIEWSNNLPLRNSFYT